MKIYRLKCLEIQGRALIVVEQLQPVENGINAMKNMKDLNLE